ncbi:MAG: thioredoxin [Lachnospiraceae bacterium]|nr:thioredoxin [Lachnospiraceae bacterium]
MVTKITNNAFEQVKSAKFAVVDYSAIWCGPCQMLAPLFHQLAEEMGDDISFFNIDVDENRDIASQMGIMNIPTIQIFKDGQKVAQQVGFQPKEAMKQWIETYRG